MLTTQSELLNLALKAKEAHQYQLARDYLVQANNLGVETEIVGELVAVYFVLHEEDQAYLMIKELPDLFSDLRIFELYQQILVAEQYFLEQQKLINVIETNFKQAEKENLLAIINSNQVLPVEVDEQDKIMDWFRKNITQGMLNTDLFKLYRLDIQNFSNLAENYFLNRFHNQRIKLSFISELIMLKVDREFNYYSINSVKKFNPIKLKLLAQTPEFREGQEIIMNKLFSDPTKLELIYSNFVEIIQTIYPMTEEYILNLASFIDVLIKYFDGVDIDKSSSEENKYLELIQKILV